MITIPDGMAPITNADYLDPELRRAARSLE
jgi:hypothetical protein